MSLYVCVNRAQVATHDAPGASVHKRSLLEMENIKRQEARYVKDLTDRIDLEVNSQQALRKHVSNAGRMVAQQQQRFRDWNQTWAARAEAAQQFRYHQAQQRYERCASQCELKDRQLNDYNRWRQTHLVDASKTELMRRSELKNGLVKDSNDIVAKYQNKAFATTR
mmetsp:Transcript_29716/g.78986  ORF Transcript_29716/g.78986 Transcript_29716/m.78986 type:complete len:166 (-) Transcript_29716:31-528(-)